MSETDPVLLSHRAALRELVLLVDLAGNDFWQIDHADQWQRAVATAKRLLADSGEIRSIDLEELRDFVSPLYRLMWVEGARQIVITREPLGDCRVAMFADVRFAAHEPGGGG